MRCTKRLVHSAKCPVALVAMGATADWRLHGSALCPAGTVIGPAAGWGRLWVPPPHPLVRRFPAGGLHPHRLLSRVDEDRRERLPYEPRLDSIVAEASFARFC